MIKSIHLRNIRTFNNETFTLTDGINLISGKNGTGKTTIIDVIGYVLFGNDDAVRKSDAIIDENNNRIGAIGRYGLVKNNCEGEAKIEIVLSHPTRDQETGSSIETEIKVVVTFKLPRTTGNPQEHWELFQDGRVINTTNKKNEVQNELWKLLGVNTIISNSFFNSILCIPQGEIISPFEKKQTDRLQYFDRIFNIKDKTALEMNYKVIDKYLKDSSSKIKMDLSYLEGQVLRKEEITSSLNKNKEELPQVQSQLTSTSTTLKSAQSELDRFDKQEKEIGETKTKIKGIEDNLKKTKNELTLCEDEIKKFENNLTKFPDYKILHDEFDSIQNNNKTLSQLENKLLQQESDKTKVEMDIEANSKELKQVNEDLDKYKKAEPNYKKYIEVNGKLESAKTQKDKRDKLVAKKDEFQSQITNMDKDIKKEMPKIGELDEVMKKKKELDEQNANLIQMEQDLKNRNNEIKKEEKQLKDFKKNICPFTEKECLASEDVSKTLNEKLAKLKEEILILNDQIKNLKESLKELSGVEKKLKELEEIKIRIDEWQNQIKKREAELAKTDAELEKLPDNTDEIKDLEDQLKELKDDHNTIEFLKKEKKTPEILENKVEKLETAIKNSQPKLDSINNKISELINDYKSLKLKEFLLDSLKKCSDISLLTGNAEIKDLSSKVEKVKEEIKESKDLTYVMDVSSKYSVLLSKYDSTYNDLKQIKDKDLPNSKKNKEKLLKDQTGFNEKLKNLQNELAELLKQYKGEDHSKKKEEVNKLNQEVGGLTQKERNLLQRIKEDEKSLTEIQKNEAQITELRTVNSQIQKKIDLNKRVRAAITSLTKLRERYIALVNQEVANINAEIGKPGIDIYWDPTYVIYIKEGASRITFSQMSGGQKTLYALMVRLAINKLFSRRFGLFVLDEPTIHLDEESRGTLGEFIRDAAGSDQLIVVSHTEEFLDEVHNQITLEKVDYQTINTSNQQSANI